MGQEDPETSIKEEYRMRAAYYEGMMKELEEYLDNKYHTVGERIDFLLSNFSDLPCLSESILRSLIDRDFCLNPASTKYHGAYDGGLFDHSLAVVHKLLELTVNLDLKWERPESPIIIGLFHDLCKLDTYEKDREGTWQYRTPIIPGHGVASVLIAERYVDLTEEEKICIVHHMGAYEKDFWNSYDVAVREYPNVLFVHTADMFASKVYGV